MADNKLAEKAGWDDEILAIEHQHLLDVGGELDISLTGFEMPEIDLIIQDTLPLDQDNEFVPEVDDTAISQLGDLWVLGEHRLYCGDALDEESYTALLGDQNAQMIFADPPYNVPIDGHVCGNGTIKHREFARLTFQLFCQREKWIILKKFRDSQ